MGPSGFWQGVLILGVRGYRVFLYFGGVLSYISLCSYIRDAGVVTMWRDIVGCHNDVLPEFNGSCTHFIVSARRYRPKSYNQTIRGLLISQLPAEIFMSWHWTQWTHDSTITSLRRHDIILTSQWRYFCVMCPLGNIMPNVNHGSHRPGKVMEFNPWLEKSLNFMFTWKNGILPGKVIENQWKSLKNSMFHV